MKICTGLYLYITHNGIHLFQIVMSQTKCPTFEDKLNAIEVWMEETEDAVSSQDSYKEDALTPEAIDPILRYASYVSLNS